MSDTDQLARWWWEVSQKPREVHEPMRMVSVSELFGGPVEAYSEWLRTDDKHEVLPRIGWGRPCMNCGVSRPEVSDNGGWCDGCSR